MAAPEPLPRLDEDDPPGECTTPAPDRPGKPCGLPARLYPCGWRCSTHRPRRTAPSVTTEGLAQVPVADAT